MHIRYEKCVTNTSQEVKNLINVKQIKQQNCHFTVHIQHMYNNWMNYSFIHKKPFQTYMHTQINIHIHTSSFNLQLQQQTSLSHYHDIWMVTLLMMNEVKTIWEKKCILSPNICECNCRLLTSCFMCLLFMSFWTIVGLWWVLLC